MLFQVYGVTVRATDGGAPALWAEATVIVEVRSARYTTLLLQ